MGDTMSVTARTRSMFTRSGIPDRVPIHCWLGLPFLRTLIPQNVTMRDWLRAEVEDPLGSIVKLQENLGLDPMMTTYSQHTGEIEHWPRWIFSYPPEAFENWQEEITEERPDPNGRNFTHKIKTPAGEGAYSYRLEGYSEWPIEHLIKSEADLELLPYRPDPMLADVSRLRRMMEQVGERAWVLHHAPGPWDEAAELRGLTVLCEDIYDNPDFVHKLMRLVTDRIKRHLKKLAEAGIHSLSLNETWVGVGLSPEVYKEFILPYDKECIDAIKEAGYLASLHNCGRGTLILEDMVSTGAHALETITSAKTSGDFDLADVKRRVGDRICLFGGFNEHVLRTGTEQQVRDEVKRCLDAAMEGGGYILRSTGQIFHARPGNVEAMCETAREYGRYA